MAAPWSEVKTWIVALFPTSKKKHKSVDRKDSAKPADDSVDVESCLTQYFQQQLLVFFPEVALSCQKSNRLSAVSLPAIYPPHDKLYKYFSIVEQDYGAPCILSLCDLMQCSDSNSKLAALTYLLSLYIFDKTATKSALDYMQHLSSCIGMHTTNVSGFENPMLQDDGNKINSNNCVACKSIVDPISRIIIDEKVWHKTCFLCSTCSLQLRQGTYRLLQAPSSYECLSHENNRILESILKRREVTIEDGQTEPTKPEDSIENVKCELSNETPKHEVEEGTPLENCHAYVSNKSSESKLQPLELKDETLQAAETNPFADEEEPLDVSADTIGAETPTQEEAGKEECKNGDRLPEEVSLTNREGEEKFENESLPSASLSEGSNKHDSGLYPELPVSSPTEEQKLEGVKPSVTVVPPAPIEASPPPVAPPRRRRGHSRNSSASRSSIVMFPSPIIGNNVQNHKPVPAPRVSKMLSTPVVPDYPDDMNPFDTDSEDDADYDDSLNPFADVADDDDDRSSYSSSLNPFADDDSDHEVERASRVPLRAPPAIPPKPAHLSGPSSGSGLSGNTSSSHSSPRTKRKSKAPAPPPPPVKKEKTPKKKRHAPPPPLPFKRKIVMDEDETLTLEEVKTTLSEVDDVWKAVVSSAQLLQTPLLSALQSKNVSDAQLNEWYNIVIKRCNLLEKEAQMVHMWREMVLNDFHAEVEFQLRCIIEKPEHDKTEGDAMKEACLLKLLLRIIEEKSSLASQQTDSMIETNLTHHAAMQKSEKKKKKIKLRLKKIKKVVKGQNKAE